MADTANQSLISASLHQGWDIFKKHIWFLIGIAVVMFIVQLLPGFLIGLAGISEESGAAGLINLAGFVLNMIVAMGWIYIMIRLIRGQETKLNDLFAKASVFFKYLFGTILYGLIVIVGLILLIVPGIIWGIKFMFTPYLIVDKEVGPMEALKMSSRMTNGLKWELFGLMIVIGIINLLGLLALGIGLLITVPVTSLAYVSAYDRLVSKSGKTDSASE